MSTAVPKKSIGLALPLSLGEQGYFATNIDTVSQISDNIVNILMTRPGERRFHNDFGSGLYNLLFENIGDDITKELIIDVIQRDVNKFLTGIAIINVELSKEQTYNNSTNSIFINITFRYNNITGNVELTINNLRA